MQKILKLALASFIPLLALGCATTSSHEEQRRSLVHQEKSDDAAAQGEYGKAGDEQRKAQDDHHQAVDKAMSEGKPIPPQPKPGDVPPPAPPN